MYNASLIKKNNIKFSALKINEDLVFIKTATAYSENKTYYLEKTLYSYNTNNMNSLMHIHKHSLDNYELTAYNEIKSRIDEGKFYKELYSIFFLEVIYAYSKKIILHSGIRKAKKEISLFLKEYNPKYDEYYNKYPLKYRIAYGVLKLLY